MKYIIQHGIGIDNLENKTINVLTPKQIGEYIQNGYSYRDRVYKLTIGHSQYEVVCGEIWRKDDIEHSLAIPAFHLPHRTYCLHVYAYAINLYRTKPSMGQRAVAKETRKKFNLKTFAHTTVGRALKELAKMFAETEVLDNGTYVDGQVTSQNNASNGGNETNDRADCSKRVQKGLDKKSLWESVMSFFYGTENNYSPQAFKEACEGISNCWNAVFHRLLL